MSIVKTFDIQNAEKASIGRVNITDKGSMMVSLNMFEQQYMIFEQREKETPFDKIGSKKEEVQKDVIYMDLVRAERYENKAGEEKTAWKNVGVIRLDNTTQDMKLKFHMFPVTVFSLVEKAQSDAFTAASTKEEGIKTVSADDEEIRIEDVPF